MGFRIEAPKQDGNARFNTLKVNLNENNLATRVVVVDGEGNFYYGSGGGGGTGGTNGTSGVNGTNGTSGANGSSGTSGTGFNTIANPLQGRLLISDGSVNRASASAALFYDTGSSTLQVTGSLVTDNLTVNADVFEFTGSINISGSLTTDQLVVNADVFEFTGSLKVSGSISGSLHGTSSWAVSASWAPNAEQAATASFVTASNVWGPFGSNSIRSASYAATASSADNFYIRADRFEFTGSLEVDGGITGSLLGTASYAITASHALNVVGTASWAYNALTASSADDFYIRADVFEFTGSLRVSGSITGSLLGTASYAITASHALNAVGTASWAYNALTASSADDFLVRGTLTAQTIVAQVITSSTQYITGSTIFGSQQSNTHQFTGSVSITGSLTVDNLTVLADVFEFTGSVIVDGGITGSLYGTSSWAVSASWAPAATQSDTASFVTASNVWGPFGSNSIRSASYAATASSADDFYIRADVFEFTGSLRVSGSITGSLLGTASYAPNIYNTDGELTGNRTISASFYSLSVISTKSTGSTFTVSHIQTQSNATDTADIGMQVSYNLSASSATNQLVARAFQLSVANNLTGSGILQNLRVFNLAAFFGTGTTTSDADLVYLERGNLTGTINNYRAIRIANFTGTNRGGIAIAAIGGTGNAAYVNMGSIVIPNGRWGIYQSEVAISNYFEGNFSIGTTQTGSYKLHVIGNTGISGSLTATGSIFFPSLIESPETNVVLVNTSTGQLHYTASSALIPLTASYALTASQALTASSADDFYIRADVFEFTGSLKVSGSISGSLHGTSSWAISASWAPAAAQSDTASFVTASNVWGPFGSNSIISASYAATASSADDFYIRSDVFEFTGSLRVSGSITGSLLGTASFATTASYALNAGSAFPFSGSAVITGSLVITGSSSSTSYLLNASGTSKLTTIHVENLKNPAIGASGQIDVFVVNNPGDAGYQKLSILAGGSPYSTVLRTSGEGGGSRGMILDASGPGGEIYFGTSNVNRWLISGTYNASGSGHIFPIGDGLYDIGNPSAKVANYYGLRSYISNLLSVTGSVLISGSSTITGSLRVSDGITGSLFGTASFALTSSNVLGGTTNYIPIWNGQTVLSSSAVYQSSGNLGIGLTNPTSTIHISGSANATLGLRIENANSSNADAFSSFQAGSSVANNRFINVGYAGQGVILQGAYRPTGSFIVSNGNGGLNFLATGSGNNAHIRFFTSATTVGGAERVIILDSGYVGIGTSTPAYPLDVNGTARVTTLIETSTRTLKENIQSYSTDLEKFKNLNPVSFNWKDTKKEDIGLIAEELEDLFPEFVSKDDTGTPIGIQYGKLGVIFINVIKEQQKRIEILENQVKQLIK